MGIHLYCGMDPEMQEDFTFAPNKPTSAAFAAGNLVKELTVGSVDLKEARKAKKLSTAAGLKPVLDWVVPEVIPTSFEWANSAAARELDLCSAFAVSNARSMATLSAILANGGALGCTAQDGTYHEGVRLLSVETCAMLAEDVKVGSMGPGVTVGLSQAGIADLGSYAGCMVPEHVASMAGWFGSVGMGGSVTMWNVEKNVGFGYTKTGMSTMSVGVPTASRLFDAMLRALNSIYTA